jgi:phage portal protein BeeE
MLTLVEQRIEKSVLSSSQRARGYVIEFNFDALLRASLKDRVEIYAKQVQNGLKTRNECRKKENDSPINDDAANQLTVQSNLVPLNKLHELGGRGSVPEQPVKQ